MFSRDANFGSGISTANPFTQADYRRTTFGKQAYKGPDQSRSAFSRALTDTNNASVFADMDDAQRGYRQKAEQARMQDVQSQRESALQNYALDEQKRVTTKRQDTFQQQKSADHEAYLDRARKDARAATIGNVAQLLLQGAMLAAPSAGAMARMAAPSISGAMPSGMNSMRTGALSLAGGLRGNNFMSSPLGYGFVNDTSMTRGLLGGLRE